MAMKNIFLCPLVSFNLMVAWHILLLIVLNSASIPFSITIPTPLWLSSSGPFLENFLGGVLSLHVPTKMGVSDDMMIATPNYNDIMFDDMINHDSYT